MAECSTALIAEICMEILPDSVRQLGEQWLDLKIPLGIWVTVEVSVRSQSCS